MNCRIRVFNMSWIALAGLLWAGSSLRAAENSLADLVKESGSSDLNARVRAIDELGAWKAEAVAPLTELLADDSPVVRAHAARSLGEIGAAAKPAVEALVELLKDPEHAVRRQAVKALATVRPGPQVTIPLFVKLMEDADAGVKIRVLHAVAEAGALAVPGLIKALKNDKAAYWACLALRAIGPAAKEAVPGLAAKLQDSRPEIRREALLALAAIGLPAASAIPPIAAALDDQHAHAAAAFALGSIGQIPADAETKLRAAAQGDDKLFASVSLWALARVHPDDKTLRKEVTESLVAQLKDTNPYVRAAAARSLAALPPAPDITFPILEKALQDADATTVYYALNALATIGAPSVPRLITALNHDKAREQVAYILGQIGPPAAPASEALAKLVADQDSAVATAAVLALAKIGPGAKKAVPELIKAFDPDEPQAACGIAFALGKIGPEAAAAEPVLQAALSSPHGELPLVSAWALVQIKSGSAENAAKIVPVLIKWLRAPTFQSRQGAVEALGSLGPAAKEAVPALQKATQDENPGVREAATQALKAIRP